MQGRDVLRQVAVAGAGVMLVGLGLTGDYGEGAAVRSPVVPAGYAFAIWAPIYLSNVAFVVQQARPSRRADPERRALGWPLAAAYASISLWSRVFAWQRPWLTGGLLGVTFASSALAYGRLWPAEGRERAWLVRLPVGLLFGWVSVATAASVSEQLLRPGGLEVDPTAVALPALAALGALGVAVSARAEGPPAYPAAVAWGLAGVAVAQRTKRPLLALVAGALGLAVAGAALVARGRRGQGAERGTRSVR
jgi:hypothetical protein